jgi:FKBP-type peptidyl-prolyl cis-trans isomerase
MRKNALMFEVGGNAVVPGINEGERLRFLTKHSCTQQTQRFTVVKEMVVGEKVQAIIPPSLAFGDKGICLESGECLVKPGATLVYDILLKRSAIPPP